MSWPKILITIDPLQDKQPYSTHHSPPLPEGCEVSISAGNLSLEALLKECVRVRSRALLQEVKEVLKDSPWDGRGKFWVGVWSV